MGGTFKKTTMNPLDYFMLTMLTIMISIRLGDIAKELKRMNDNN